LADFSSFFLRGRISSFHFFFARLRGTFLAAGASPQSFKMKVDAEIRPVVREAAGGKGAAAAATQAQEQTQASPAPPAAKDGLLYGRVKLAGLHPQLVPAIPSPETFKGSLHYPLYITNSPFVKQVRFQGVVHFPAD
jgi:hypothetical protein